MDRAELKRIITLQVVRGNDMLPSGVMDAVDVYVSQFRLNEHARGHGEGYALGLNDARNKMASDRATRSTPIKPESHIRTLQYEVLRTNRITNADEPLAREDWVSISVQPNAKAAHEAQARLSGANTPNHYVVEEVEIYRAILEPPAPTTWNMTVFPLDESIPHHVHEVTLAQLEDPQYNGYWKISAEAVKNSRRIIIEPKE